MGEEVHRHAFLSSLRGWAVIGVVAVHVSQMVPLLGGLFRLVVDQGARGVQLFFVVSAYTLMLSWHRRHDGIIPFYIRRLFRIAPVFWIAIVGFVVLDGFGPRHWAPDGITWWHVAATALFQHGWHPETITSVVPGGWTIAVEMTFYALFPAIAMICKSWWQAILFAAGSLVLFVIGTSDALVWSGYEPEYLAGTFRFLWFFSQFPIFMFGIVACLLAPAVSRWPYRRKCLTGLAALAALALLILLRMSVFSWGHLLYGAAFAVLTIALSAGWKSWLVSRVVGWIGDRSFSAYLWHFAVLSLIGKIGISAPTITGVAELDFVILFFGVFGVTMFVSDMTYRWIELPTTRLGGRIAKIAASRRAQPASINAVR